MKVLVSTKDKQGVRMNDFSWADEGEIVGMGNMECDGERVDGKCGCRRSFGGYVSHKATTTAKVVEQDVTVQQLFDVAKKSLLEGGWKSSDEEIMDEVKEIARVAAAFDVNTILEKRGNEIVVRR